MSVNSEDFNFEWTIADFLLPIIEELEGCEVSVFLKEIYAIINSLSKIEVEVYNELHSGRKYTFHEYKPNKNRIKTKTFPDFDFIQDSLIGAELTLGEQMVYCSHPACVKVYEIQSQLNVLESRCNIAKTLAGFKANLRYDNEHNFIQVLNLFPDLVDDFSVKTKLKPMPSPSLLDPREKDKLHRTHFKKRITCTTMPTGSRAPLVEQGRGLRASRIYR